MGCHAINSVKAQKETRVYWPHSNDLPMWPSGQRTRPPCAVEHDALSGRGSRSSPSTSAFQRIISNNSYAHDEHAVNPR